MIKPYLRNIIDTLKESAESNTQLSVKIAFTSPKDIDENHHKNLMDDNKENYDW